MMKKHADRPSAAFIAASWCALLLGSASCLIGLFNAEMQRNEKGFHGMAYALALFGAVAVQKNTRDLMAAGVIHGEAPLPSEE